MKRLLDSVGAVHLGLGLVLAKVALHLALVERYGYHRDELYFIECGNQLAWGYVDHPPLVPWIARVAGALGEHTLFSLRLLPALTGAATLWLTVLVARRLGGGRYAQGLAGLAVLVAPAYLRMGVMLNIVVFEPFFWTLCSYLVLRILQDGSARQWLLVGLCAGIGLLNKHTMLLWGSGLVVGLLLSSERGQLRSPWLWAGGAVALLIFSPNLLWQWQNDWATVEFLRNMSEGTLAEVPRSLFLFGQLLYMHPVALLVWLPGLVWLLSPAGGYCRPFGWSFLFVGGALLLTHAKPYYLAPAYPVLLAAGAVFLEARYEYLRTWVRKGVACTLAVTGLLLGVLSLPLLPLARTEAALDALFGRFVPVVALTHDMRDEFGWPELVAEVAGVVDEERERGRAPELLLTRNYGQASALNFFGGERGLPRAVSGHLSYHLWGPGEPGRGRALLVGDPTWAASICPDAALAATFSHPLAMEDGTAVLTCDAINLKERWRQLKRYRHDSAEAE